jgi:hypothetical protein
MRLVLQGESILGREAIELDRVLAGYAECALWSESCRGMATGAHADPAWCAGSDCDSSLWEIGFDADAISFGSMENMRDDVRDFVNGCLAERVDAFDGFEQGQIGHDFWLTRNGHGAGFWDRGLGERGQFLTGMAKPYGDCSLWVGEDGRVYYQA